MAKKKAGNVLRITYIRSSIGFSKKHKATIRALGLKRLNQVVEQPDNPAIRGMLAKVDRLVKIEEQE